MELSIVVPVFREEKNIPAFLSRLRPVLRRITENHEIIFALDPSPDGTESAILRERETDPRIKLLTFSRRFGQPMSVFAGLCAARGSAVIVMDVDLQDPPELIEKMVEQWRSGFDVVYAQRERRTGEPWIKKLVAWLGYKMINRVAEVDIPPNTGDFRLMSRRVVNHVISLKETHGFLRGMVALVGFKTGAVTFERTERAHGLSHYNRFFGSIRIGMNGIVCFSNYLLTLSTLLGFATAAFSFLLAVVYLALKINGTPFPLGNPTIVILVLFLGGVQLISVGILGEYVGRIYDEVKGRPKFILDKTYGVEEAQVNPLPKP